MRDKQPTYYLPSQQHIHWLGKLTRQLSDKISQYPCTVAYITLVIFVNNLFIYAPYIKINGSLISFGDLAVGVVYILRDFAQREIKHYVFGAMIIGCFLSYVFADKEVAVASVSAFFVGEFIDWGIYSFTRKPLSQRLLWSSCISAPADSAIFLYLTQMLNKEGLIVLTLGKFIGIFMLWYLWHRRNQVRNKFI